MKLTRREGGSVFLFTVLLVEGSRGEGCAAVVLSISLNGVIIEAAAELLYLTKAL